MTLSEVSKYSSLLLAAGLVFFGTQKFGAENIVFETIANRSGIDLFEPVIRRATGVAELFAAVLLVWSRTRLLGALGAAAIIGGAIAFHLSPWLGVNVPEVGHGLFYTAVAMFGLSSFNLMTLRVSGANLLPA